MDDLKEDTKKRKTSLLALLSFKEWPIWIRILLLPVLYILALRDVNTPPLTGQVINRPLWQRIFLLPKLWKQHYNVMRRYSEDYVQFKERGDWRGYPWALPRLWYV